MSAQIIFLGVDHRRAALAAREQLSFSPAEQELLLPQLAAVPDVEEALMLSTCNRTELYLAVQDETAQATVVLRVLEMLQRFRPSARRVCEEAMHSSELGERAALHLFRVASGIDSQILGDTHIVMQLKQAHLTAALAGTLGPLLDRTVTEGLRAAKRARRETAIGRGASSVGAAVLRSVRSVFPDPTQVRVLVLGGGEVGRDIARQLTKARVGILRFATRNPEQAAALARAYGGESIAWDNTPDALESANVVIAATAARLALLSRESLAAVLENRPDPLLVIDAGVPRNADPEAKTLSGVRIVDLDGLEQEQGAARASRELEIPRVEAILADELKRWRRWWHRRTATRRNERIGEFMSKAMVVDDSRAIRMILAGILGELGYEVRQAVNGRDALDQLHQNSDLSLFLVDWNMPEMNGIDFVKQIRKDARFAKVPVMMVTTETEIAQMERALASGANEYVMKPFTKEMIEEKLRMVGAAL